MATVTDRSLRAAALGSAVSGLTDHRGAFLGEETYVPHLHPRRTLS
jgi:hypothetical protein